MPFLTVTITGLTEAKLRLSSLPDRVRAALVEACQASGDEVVANLAAAAPRGANAGSSDTPVPGDAGSGPLAESFSATTVAGAVITTTVVTSQPVKLGYVRRGTGLYGPSGQPIVPRVKRALMWPGAEHPVRSVSGMRPNDFVTPVLDAAADAALARITEAVAGVLVEE